MREQGVEVENVERCFFRVLEPVSRMAGLHPDGSE